ncbi:RagB/SusD family nutrient uptake outer membrane protein [Prevotella sp. E13-27]|uniref:RagB/SusD family nutrient uptake outer membrane protein n=1 Tax=Prevotella sp. E13-27 TaxID=2938122 RepID=UPI00200A69DB|nr:RagB/SusD family nutrient uptake outer membrane protein [Prevotella sp. E13-27]MCK8620908.1 RagB/SusD family nutrient uptake outer membrane protein [Prevotella sp. E13-27]
MKTIYRLLCTICVFGGLMSCSDFLEEQVPQATLTQDEVKDPEYIDNVIVSAYAGLVSIEDMNASFSLWNYDTRSDDAYVGGSDFSDGEPFHRLEKGTGVMTTDWPFSSIWNKFYSYLSRISLSLDMLKEADQSNAIIKQRTAEMKFLRAYGHFQLKRLFKKIPFVNKSNMTEDDYNNLSNTEYTNDEGWQQIINDLEEAYNVLPETQSDKGRPTKAACAAFLAKVYLYKAYHQDDVNSNQVTSINEADLQKVIEYTDPSIYAKGGYGLESDLHNNFRPEEQYENGKESLWAIQYSKNDGTTYGNLNFSNRLIVPCIPKVHDSGCDFYKPSHNLVDAYRTNSDGLPMLDNFATVDYKVGSAETVDPRLFITVGVPGTPYMFNTSFMMSETGAWSRSGGTFGYFVSLKQNVNPILTDNYLYLCDSQWASSMNRIVFRYADVLLMRAEALAQLNNTAEAVIFVNQVRDRAISMMTNSVVAGYPNKYGIHYAVGKYNGTYSKEEMMKIVKMERRLELAMESERFFDLVRWGDAATVLNKYYSDESKKMSFLNGSSFTANKNEYLPIPFEQMAASNGHYTQNCGEW